MTVQGTDRHAPEPAFSPLRDGVTVVTVVPHITREGELCPVLRPRRVTVEAGPMTVQNTDRHAWKAWIYSICDGVTVVTVVPRFLSMCWRESVLSAVMGAR